MEQKVVLSVLIVSVLIASAFLVSANVSGKNTVSHISPFHVADSRNDNAPEISEAQEVAQLAPLAKITAEEAKTIALVEVPGTIKKVELENENGNVVYSVEITNNNKETDVKVDAGNGKVLKIESDNDKSDTGDKESAEIENEKNSDFAKDGINHEFSGDEGNHED